MRSKKIRILNKKELNRVIEKYMIPLSELSRLSGVPYTTVRNYLRSEGAGTTYLNWVALCDAARELAQAVMSPPGETVAGKKTYDTARMLTDTEPMPGQRSFDDDTYRDHYPDSEGGEE